MNIVIFLKCILVLLSCALTSETLLTATAKIEVTILLSIIFCSVIWYPWSGDNRMNFYFLWSFCFLCKWRQILALIYGLSVSFLPIARSLLWTFDNSKYNLLFKLCIWIPLLNAMFIQTMLILTLLLYITIFIYARGSVWIVLWVLMEIRVKVCLIN